MRPARRNKGSFQRVYLQAKETLPHGKRMGLRAMDRSLRVRIAVTTVVLAMSLVATWGASASLARNSAGFGNVFAPVDASCSPGPIGSADEVLPVDAPCSRYIVVYDTRTGAILGAMTYVPRNVEAGVADVEPGLGAGQAAVDVTNDPLRTEFISWTMFPSGAETWSIDLATHQLDRHL